MADGAIGEVGKVATSALDAMKGAPLAIALLLVNVGFLGFASYVLGQVATNASERNKTQMELITNLVEGIRDCRQAPRQQQQNYDPNKSMLRLPPPPKLTEPVNDPP